LQTYAQEISDVLQQYGRCSLPGIGLLYIIQNVAERSYQDNKLYPPSFSIVLDPAPQPEGTTFSIIPQIAFAHAVSPEEAARQWTETAGAIKEKLSTGSSVELAGLGFLNLDEKGRISFAASNQSLSLYDVLPIENAQRPPQKTAAGASGTAGTVENEAADASPPFPEPTRQRQSRSRWWIAGSIIILLLIGWFTYRGTVQRKRKATVIKHILKKESATRSLAATDSLKLQSDSVMQHHDLMTDSIHYKIIFAVYDRKEKALRQFHKMRNWGHPVVLVTKDSATFELAWPFTSLRSDTDVNLIKMKKLYGDRVHIEYDSDK
jgi:hypothetical protein